MDIITCFYYSDNKNRQQELESVLLENLNNNFINNIHLFMEIKDSDIFLKSEFINNPNYNKIIIVNFNNQPKYPDLFIYSSKIKNKICCISNSDIRISIENNYLNLLDRLYNNKLIYFLTRHESDLSCPLINNFGGSHDAFIFHSDTVYYDIINLDLSSIDYKQNTSGIEALLTLFFIETLNYKIMNPCYQIKLIHYHKSQYRSWQKFDNKIVGYTYPTLIPGYPGIYNKYMIYPCII